MSLLSDYEVMPPRRARSVGSLPTADVMGHSGLIKTDDRELFTFAMWRGAAETVTVTVGGRVRCQDGVWSNDNSIAFYMRWFMEENPPPLEPQFHFSTHFFAKLTENGGMNYGNVRRWTKRAGLFDKSVVTIPIEYRKLESHYRRELGHACEGGSPFCDFGRATKPLTATTTTTTKGSSARHPTPK